MNRLVLQLIFVVIVVPTIYNYILVSYSPQSFREPYKDSSLVDKMPSEAETNRIPRATIFIDTIAYIDEYFIRFIT